MTPTELLKDAILLPLTIGHLNHNKQKPLPIQRFKVQSFDPLVINITYIGPLTNDLHDAKVCFETWGHRYDLLLGQLEIRYISRDYWGNTTVSLRAEITNINRHDY